MTRILDTWADSDSPITLELYYSAAWHDITAYLSEDGVQITRGRSEWAGTADPSEMTCTLDNTGGRFSPRNPNSPLYGLIGRNTPIRVSVTTNSVTYARFYGEVVSWPQGWTKRGTPYTPIQCAGITRRLGQGRSPLKSCYFRACASAVAAVTGLVAYWPCEDEVGASSIAPGLPGGSPMVISGTPTLATNEELFKCSAPLPDIGSASLSGIVPNYVSTGEIQVRMLLSVPAAGTTNGAVLFSVRCGGTAARWELVYSTASGGSLSLNAYSETGTSLLSTAATSFSLNGNPLRLGLSLAQNGTGVDYTFSTLGVGSETGGYISGTLASNSVTAAKAVAVAPGKNLSGCILGHVTVQSDVTSIFELSDQLDAYRGETAAARVVRLCTEEGVAGYAGSADCALVGYQGRKTLLDLLAECQESDSGVLYETRSVMGIGYLPQLYVCSKDPVATIAYTENLLSPFKPVEDDRLTRNKVTITRDGGSSYISEVTSGPLNTSTPSDDPEGVGLYDEGLTLSLAYDSQAATQATWRTHLGTVDEARWPKIGVELAHPTFLADTTLTADVLTLTIGDRLLVTNVPDFLPPFDVDQLIVGYVEEITPKRYKITFNCVPYSPFSVGVYDDAGSRYSGAGTVLAEDLDTTETGIDITAPDGVSWAHDDGNYVVITGGEMMTVTGISGSAPNYTLTVTRSVNGVVKTHSTGADIDLASPVFYGP